MLDEVGEDRGVRGRGHLVAARPIAEAVSRQVERNDAMVGPQRCDHVTPDEAPEARMDEQEHWAAAFVGVGDPGVGQIDRSDWIGPDL